MKNALLTSLDSTPSFAAGGEPISGDRPSDRSSQPAHAPGDILAGRYEIISLLGEGGMGTVWRARSLVLDIDIALKVLHCDRTDALSAQRLLREARATASVGHPSIVRAIDFGETDAGEPFLVMELLEGRSLAGWLDQKGRMSATQAVQMLLPVASGLAAAHARGIVHRDIKPENIIIVPDGPTTFVPKIVDFGIAKLAHRGGQIITQAGMVLGSLEYMSPEQAEGKQEVGEQTDVWALCVVLYELITGRRPFEGQNITAMIYALYTLDPVPITEFAAGDEELWQIISRGLEKAPENRWATMLDLGRALASWAARRGLTVDAGGTSLTHHWLAPEVAGIVLASPEQPDFTPCWTRVSLPSIDPGARTETQLSPPEAAPARLGTIEISCASTDRRPAAPTRPALGKPVVFGAGLALLAGALVTAAALYVSTGTDGTSRADRQVASASTIGDPGVAWPSTAAGSRETADPGTASNATTGTKEAGLPASTSKSRDLKPASSSLPGRSPKTMPLPAAPNF